MTSQSSTVGAYAAKTHLPELLARVEAGEEITVTKHGRPVARIVPPVPQQPDVRATIEAIIASRTTTIVSTDELRSWIAEGRR